MYSGCKFEDIKIEISTFRFSVLKSELGSMSKTVFRVLEYGINKTVCIALHPIQGYDVDLRPNKPSFNPEGFKKSKLTFSTEELKFYKEESKARGYGQN